MVLFRCAYPWRPLAAILVAYVKLIKCPCFVEIIPVVENSSSGCRQINPCVWILLWYLAKEIWTKGLDSFTRMHYRKSWCQAPEAAVTVERCLHKSLVNNNILMWQSSVFEVLWKFLVCIPPALWWCAGALSHWPCKHPCSDSLPRTV